MNLCITLQQRWETCRAPVAHHPRGPALEQWWGIRGVRYWNHWMILQAAGLMPGQTGLCLSWPRRSRRRKRTDVCVAEQHHVLSVLAHAAPVSEAEKLP